MEHFVPIVDLLSNNKYCYETIAAFQKFKQECLKIF